MPGQARPNPSILVLTLEDTSADLRALSNRLRRIAGDTDESGSAMVKLNDGRYAVSRALSKKLRYGKSPFEVAEELEKLTEIRTARFRKANEIKSAYENFEEPLTTVVPSTPDAHGVPTEQWNLGMVKAQQAWDQMGGDATKLDYGGVAIGHIDTGVTPHPALGFSNGMPSPFVKVDEGQNYVDAGNSLPEDPMGYSGQGGHGTRTMSVLAARAPNEMMGVAPGVPVVPYRITNIVVIDELGNDTRIEDAINHAVHVRGCDVLSISLGDPCFPSSEVGRAVDAAYDVGAIIVAAAGNITSEVTYPGRYSRTIAAGGVSPDKKPWSGGSRGRKVDVCAPADEVFRAGVERNDDGTYTFNYLSKDGDGTSYATTHVSGAAALWLAHRGSDIDEKYGATWERVEAFRAIVRSTAQIPKGWNSRLFGAGILDISAILQEPLPDPATLKHKPVAEREKH